MSVHASFLDQLKQLIDRIFHRDCGLSESDCQRLKSMNEHFKNVPAKQAIVSGNLSLHHRPGTNVKLVAYTKSGGDTNTAEIQMEVIRDYCSSHGYTIHAHYEWKSESPALAVHDAIMALEHCDGLIVTDLARLVEHHDDPLRDLTPLVHDHFVHCNKHLISVKEGVNTSTTSGQQLLVEYMNELRDIEHQRC